MVSLSSIGGFAASAARAGREPPSFQSLDTDKSSGISLDEFKAAGPGGASDAASAARAEKMFKAMDADSDGSVSEDEKESFDSKMQERLQSMQFVAQLAGAGQSGLFDDSDSDSSGGLDIDEFTAALTAASGSEETASAASTSDSQAIDELFAAIDADSDGSITEEETQFFLKQAGPPPGGPPPGGSAEDDEEDTASAISSLLSMAASRYGSAASLGQSDTASLLSRLA